MRALLHDAGGMTLIWSGWCLALTGVIHLMMVCIPGERRCHRWFRSEAVWYLRLLQGDVAAPWAFIQVLMMTVPGIAFSEVLMLWGFLWPGITLQCLILLYAGSCLFNTVRRTVGFPGLRTLTALLISLLSVRMGWLVTYAVLP